MATETTKIEYVVEANAKNYQEALKKMQDEQKEFGKQAQQTAKTSNEVIRNELTKTNTAHKVSHF